MQNFKALAKFVQRFDVKMSFDPATKSFSFKGTGETIDTTGLSLDELKAVAADINALPDAIDEVVAKIDEFGKALAGVL